MFRCSLEHQSFRTKHRVVSIPPGLQSCLLWAWIRTLKTRQPIPLNYTCRGQLQPPCRFLRVVGEGFGDGCPEALANAVKFSWLRRRHRQRIIEVGHWVPQTHEETYRKARSEDQLQFGPRMNCFGAVASWIRVPDISANRNLLTHTSNTTPSPSFQGWRLR
jgi:hypothetical protein